MTNHKKFVVYDNTEIKFGKLIGKPHKELLKPENNDYCDWLLNLEEFYYTATLDYIKKNKIKSINNITFKDYLELLHRDENDLTETEIDLLNECNEKIDNI